MSVSRRNGRDGYFIHFVYELPDGKSIRVRQKSQHKNLRDAKDEEEALRRAVKDGTYKIREGEDTLAAFAEEFFRRGMAKNKRSTKSGYRTVYEQHLCKPFGSKKLSEITRSIIDSFRADLEDEADEDDKLADNTINNILRVLHRMLVVAKEWGDFKGDVPKMKLLPPGVGSSITTDDYLLPDEAFEFVRAARSEMYRVMALVAVRTGLRLGELRALCWREVDFDRAQINVVRAYSRNEITTPKGKRRRDVPLPSDAVAALAARKRAAGDRDLVFCRGDGTRLDHKDAETEFKEMWFLAGLRGCKLQRPALPVHLDSDGIGKFLLDREEKGSCENYLYLLRRNLNWWMPLLAGRDLNELDEAEIRRLVLHDQHGPAHVQHQKLTAIRALIRFTRGEEEPKGSRRPLGFAVKKVGTFPSGKGWHLLRHSFASHCVMAGYHLREVQVWMGHATIEMTERYAHLAPRKGSTDKLADTRLLQLYDTPVTPEPTNVVHLADFQSRNESVARPDLVTGPVFKTGGGR